MADQPKLPNPQLTVYLDDGSVHEVQTYNADLLVWDRTRARRKWPQAEEARNVWLTFIAWAALKREGVIGEMTLDEFERRALSVLPTPDEEEDGDEPGVGPTRKAAGPT